MGNGRMGTYREGWEKPPETGYSQFCLGLAMWMIFADILCLLCLLELKIE